MRVVKTKARGPRSKHNPAHSVRGDERRPFFRCSVHIRRNELSMPMQLLPCIRVVMHFDRHRLTLFETQQGTRELTVVDDRRNDALWRDLNRTRFDTHGIVCRASFGLHRRRYERSWSECRRQPERSSGLQQPSACCPCHLEKAPTRCKLLMKPFSVRVNCSFYELTLRRYATSATLVLTLIFFGCHAS